DSRLADPSRSGPAGHRRPARRGTHARWSNAARNDATRTASARRHVVRRGETLWSIAKRHGIGMNQLASSNGLSTQSTLAVGKVLSVPGTARLAATGNAVPTARSTTYVIRRGDTLSTIAGRFRVRLNDLL